MSRLAALASPLLALACAGDAPGGRVSRPVLDEAVVAPGPAVDSGTADTAHTGTTEPQAPPVVYVQQVPEFLYADGRSSGEVVVAAYDASGHAVADGVELGLSSSLGNLQMHAVRAGRARGVLTAGTWPGTATLGAPGLSLVGPTTVELRRAPPTSAQLHLHGSLSEGRGRMFEHAQEADAVGVDVLWWTDHELAYYPEQFLELDGFDFEGGSLTRELAAWPGKGQVTVSWQPYVQELSSTTWAVTGDAAHWGNYGLRLGGSRERRADGTISTLGLDLRATPRVNYKPLLADVSLKFAYRPSTLVDGASLQVEVPLSARAAGDNTVGSDYARVVLHHPADADVVDDGRTLWVPLDGAAGQWNTARVNLTSVVGDAWPEAGDVHAEFVRVAVTMRGKGTVAYDLDDFRFDQELRGGELAEAQQAYLDGLGSVARHYVGIEYSWLTGGHLTAYGDVVDFIPYWDGSDRTLYDGVAQAHESGSVVSLAHMFGTGTEVFDEPERRVMVTETLANLLTTQAYGCDLIEVGYRQRGGNLHDHLAVWDGLTERGVYLTGTGVSDQHSSGSWSAFVNNFVTWVSSPTDSREDLTWNLARGAAWFGDPSLFPGAEVSLAFSAPDLRADAGQVVVGASLPTRLNVDIDPLQAGWSVRLVRDGDEVISWSVATSGRFTREVEVDPSGGGVFRVEVETETGLEALYSNFIAFVDEAPDDAVLGWRVPRP